MTRTTGVFRAWYLADFFSDQEMFQIKFVEKIKTQFYFQYFFPPKIVSFMRWCGKIWYSQTGHRWQCNTAHALCMLDNYGYRHPLTMCNTYCFSRAMVMRTLHNATLYVHCLSCFSGRGGGGLVTSYWHSEDRASWYFLIIGANEMHYFSNLFDKFLYMFRRSTVHHQEYLNTAYTQ